MTNPDLFADSCAVLIGVSAYEHAEYPPIRAARNSLQAMHALLRDPELCGWPPERIKVIPDPISAADLAVQLADLAENTTGVMVLYYVGHGALAERGELCLTVTSTRPNRAKITGIAWDTIADIMRTCPARVRITILDCCFAGQAIESLAPDDGPGLADITHVEGVYTLTATTRNHTAYVPPPDQQDTESTSFTAELLDLIRSGIPDKPPWLTLGDIYPILRRRLRAKGLPAPNQRGTDTVLQFSFTANAAIRQEDTAAADRRSRLVAPPPRTSGTAAAAALRRPERQYDVRPWVREGEPALGGHAHYAEFMTSMNRDEDLPESRKAKRLSVNEEVAELFAGLFEPIESSGQGSRVVKIYMYQGEYKLAWTAGGEGNYFRVTKERPSQRQTILVSEVLKAPGPTTGELVVRIDNSGRQIFSVDASKLEWKLSFEFKA